MITVREGVLEDNLHKSPQPLAVGNSAHRQNLARGTVPHKGIRRKPTKQKLHFFKKILKKGLTTDSQCAIMVTVRENTSKDTPRHFTG